MSSYIFILLSVSSNVIFVPSDEASVSGLKTFGPVVGEYEKMAKFASKVVYYYGGA
jgi:hypothetical protein